MNAGTLHAPSTSKPFWIDEVLNMYWSTPAMSNKKQDFQHPLVEDPYLVEGINHPLNGIYRDEVSSPLGKEVSLRRKQPKHRNDDDTLSKLRY